MAIVSLLMKMVSNPITVCYLPYFSVSALRTLQGVLVRHTITY